IEDCKLCIVSFALGVASPYSVWTMPARRMMHPSVVLRGKLGPTETIDAGSEILDPRLTNNGYVIPADKAKGRIARISFSLMYDSGSSAPPIWINRPRSSAISAMWANEIGNLRYHRTHQKIMS